MIDTLGQMGGTAFITYGPRIVAGIVTLVLGWIAAKVLRSGLRSALQRTAVDPTASTFCVNLVYIIALTLVVILALSGFGFPTISFAAVLGAASLAIGLALKSSLSNFAAGVILIALRPFNVGDRIDAAGVSGVVMSIQVFATTIEGEGGKKIIIPNASITGGNITNHTST